MSNRVAKPASPAAVPSEVPGLAYFTEAGAPAPAEKSARKLAKPTAIDQMFAYYTAE